MVWSRQINFEYALVEKRENIMLTQIREEEIRIEVQRIYEQAKKNLSFKECALSESALSDTIPGYRAPELPFAAYEEDKFAVLFVDMRKSTQRAERLRGEKTFLTMHIYLPTVIAVIREHHGYPIDIMGDGVMALFGGKYSKRAISICVQDAGLCGESLLQVKESIINRILKEENIEAIDFGVGIDYERVIVTKIGFKDIFDVKAFGDCINKASKYSSVFNEVKVGKRIKQKWPKGKTGRIRFEGTDKDGYTMQRI